MVETLLGVDGSMGLRFGHPVVSTESQTELCEL